MSTQAQSGTRSWLEDVLPDLVSPRLPDINVFEVLSDGPGHQITQEEFVYVVDIPLSTVAPHQARDKRYYLRIAGKIRPMTHVHVMDVMRRPEPQRSPSPSFLLTVKSSSIDIIPVGFANFSPSGFTL